MHSVRERDLLNCRKSKRMLAARRLRRGDRRNVTSHIDLAACVHPVRRRVLLPWRLNDKASVPKRRLGS